MKTINLITGAVSLFALAACSIEVDTDDADTNYAVPETASTEEVKSLPARGPGQILAESTSADWMTIDPENTLYIELQQGRIVVALTPDLAQVHVTQVKKLAREGYYDGLDFYRVIEGFVAQGGDESAEKEITTAAKSMIAEFDEDWRDALAFTPLGNPDGYAAEAGYINGFPAGRNVDEGKVWLAHCTGAFAFGRDTPRDSASTEFYITLQPQRYLDRNLTVFGRVVWGMEHVQSITRGEPGNGGVIADRSRWTPIRSIRVAADMPEGERLELEMLDTTTPAFAELIEARRNRPEEFFYYRPDHLDLCQLALPVRVKQSTEPVRSE